MGDRRISLLLFVVGLFAFKGLCSVMPEMPVTFYGNIYIDGNPVVIGEVRTVAVRCGTNVLATCDVDAQGTFDYVLPVPYSSNSSDLTTLHSGDAIGFYIDDCALSVFSYNVVGSSGGDIQLDLNVDYVSLIIDNPYGMQSVALTNVYLKGSPVGLFAPLVLISGDGVRYESTGFTGSGSAPDSGDDIELQFVLTNNTSVVWHWDETYQLQVLVTPEFGGLVESLPLTEDVYLPFGTRVQLAADPTAGYLFGSWSGDCIGIVSNTSVLMTGPKTVLAEFLVDQNEDEIPDDWQVTYFGNIFAYDAQWNIDADLDGMTAYQEWVSGTDPQDTESVFHIQELAVQQNNLTLSWPTKPGRTYRVWMRRNMVGPWEPYPDEQSDVIGDGTVKMLSLTNPAPSAFFKVEVWK